MRKSRSSEAQIVPIQREFDAGTPADELARRHGFYANHPAVAIQIRRYERQRSRSTQATRGRERANAAHHRWSNRQDRRN